MYRRFSLRGRKRRKERTAAIKWGRKLFAAGREQEAYEFLQKAVQEFPDDPEIRLLYATSLLAVRPADAVPEIIKAIDMGPSEPIRLTNAAGILFKMGQVETARSYAARAKELASRDFVFMPYLINLDSHFAALEGNDELAEEGFRLAVKREPDGETFAVDLASFLSKRGRQEEALEVIDKALPQTKRPEPLERLRRDLLSNPDPRAKE
ncbi:MAG: tetratricopeptide repeat protein [Solirubrobacterales bacterium]